MIIRDKNGRNLVDISDVAGIRLYNYTPKGSNNGWIDTTKQIIDANFIGRTPNSNRPIYTNTTEDTVARSIYNSGNISMVQDGNVIHVTVKDYDFDGRFPYKVADKAHDNLAFSDNIGAFSTFTVQFFVEDNSETNQSGKGYWMDVKVDNMKATTVSDTSVDTQMVTTDDENRVPYILYQAGIYWRDHYFFNWANTKQLHSAWNTGDGAAYRNTNVLGTICLLQNTNNTIEYHAIKGINALYKFDAAGFEILPETKDGGKFTSNNTNGINFNMYYAAKKDGTNWKSDSEMNNADYGDLKYYNTLDELYADGNEYCVATLFETSECNWYVPENGNAIRLGIPLRVRETAKFGQTYQETSRIQYFNREVDRTKESMMVEGGEYDTTNGMVYNDFPKDYIKTEYDENGVLETGTHVNVYRGNSLLVLGAETIIKNEILNTNSDGSVKTSYDMGKSEYNVKYKITPSLNSSNTDADVTTATVKITDDLPKGLTYVPNSSNYMEPEITENDDGSTTLTWYVYDAVINEPMDEITFEAHISEDSSDGTQYTTIATIFAGDIDKRKVELRRSSNAISIINLASHRLYKTIDTPVIERNGVIHFTVSYKNNTDDTIPNFQLLDILPYNGDSRGTSFNGTYTLDKLVVTQEGSDGTTISNDNLSVLYTNDENARNTNSKDENLGVGWNEASTQDINQQATAFCVKGEVGEQGKVTVDVYLKTNGNKGLDKYVNNSTAQVYANAEEMQTSNVSSQVIKRKLEGMAWLDDNSNGIKDENESFASGAEVTLLDENGNQAKDVDGDVISSVKTDENGYYSFVDLPKGNYYVKVASPLFKYTLTEKQVGTNATINSKFNVENSETDEITKLNTSNLPELTVSNVNAGFIKKPAKIIVNHVEVGTNTKLLDEETIEGTADDKYETSQKLDEINSKYDNEYEYVRVDGESEGVMKGDTEYITYYYQKKTTDVVVRHVTDTGIVLQEDAPIVGHIDEPYTTHQEEFEKYEIKIVPDNAIGVMTKDRIVVTYVYTQIFGKVTLTKVKKEDGVTPVVGAKYRLESEDKEVTQEKETDSNGKIVFENLPVGKYTITEIEAPSGYEIDTKTVNTEITKELRERSIDTTNSVKSSKVVVNHVDIDTNEKLLDEQEINGKIDEKYTTKEKLEEINKKYEDKYEYVKVEGEQEGKIEENTKYITYYYQKKSTDVVVRHVTDTGILLQEDSPIVGKIGDNYTTHQEEFNGYEIKTIPENATGTMQKDRITVTYVYTQILGSITITKTDKDDDKKAVSGAKYRLESEDKSITLEGTTDEEGKLVFEGLPIGKYTITEIEAPTGYELDNNTIEVEITEDERNIELKATNKLKEVPNTSDINVIGVTLVVLVSIYGIVITRKIILSK